jgi:hypothetical protein
LGRELTDPFRITFPQLVEAAAELFIPHDQLAPFCAGRLEEAFYKSWETHVLLSWQVHRALHKLVGRELASHRAEIFFRRPIPACRPAAVMHPAGK